MSTVDPTTAHKPLTETQQIVTPSKNASEVEEERPDSSIVEKQINGNRNETRGEKERIDERRREKGTRKKKGSKNDSLVDKEKTDKKKRRKKKRNGKVMKNGNERNKNKNGNTPTDMTPTTVAPTLKVDPKERNQRRNKKVRPGASKDQKQLKKREKSRNKNKGKSSTRRKGLGASRYSFDASTVAPTTSQARDDERQKDEQETN